MRKDQAGEHKRILLTSKIALLIQLGIKSWPWNKQLIPIHILTSDLTEQLLKWDKSSELLSEILCVHRVMWTTAVFPSEQNSNVMTPKCKVP